MEKKNRSRKSILTIGIITIALSLIFAVGMTVALFTSEAGQTINVSSGNLEISATADTLEVYSNGAKQSGKVFANGGTAEIAGSALNIERMTPMDSVTFVIRVENKSNIASKVKINFASNLSGEGVKDLYPALKFSFKRSEGEQYQQFTAETAWVDVAANGTIQPIYVQVEFPDKDNNNDYKQALCSVLIEVEAVQGNSPQK